MIEQPPAGPDLAPPQPGTGLPSAPAAPLAAPFPAAATMRRGQLSVGWQIMVAATWAGVFFAFAATWKVSVEIGIGTWWLGPRAHPRALVVRIAPFALALVVAMTAVYNVPRVALVSLSGSIVLALVAVPDMSRSGGLAAIEFAIAGAAMLVSLGALTGTYRRVAAPPPPHTPAAG